MHFSAIFLALLSTRCRVEASSTLIVDSREPEPTGILTLSDLNRATIDNSIPSSKGDSVSLSVGDKDLAASITIAPNVDNTGALNDDNGALPNNSPDNGNEQENDSGAADYKDGAKEGTEDIASSEIEADMSANHGDTSIVQNNISMNGAWRRITDSEVLVYTVGILLVAVLILGLVVLSIVLGRLVQTEEKPMYLMPPPNGAHWRHDPVFEMPYGYPISSEAAFKEQSLHAPKKEV